MNFYRLSAEERAVRMRALGVEALKRWDAADDQEPELVKLRENAVFKVQGPGGAPAALRIHRHGYHTDAELDSELIWMAALREGGSVRRASCGRAQVRCSRPSRMKVCPSRARSTCWNGSTASPSARSRRA